MKTVYWLKKKDSEFCIIKEDIYVYHKNVSL